MCQAVKNYLCGGFLGNFQDKHTSPPNSDDEDSDAERDPEEEAEKAKYLPKDHKRALKSLTRLGLVRKLKVPDSHVLSMGWGPYTNWIRLELKRDSDVRTQRFQAIVVTRETITPYMLGKLSSDTRQDNLHTLDITRCHLKQLPKIGDLYSLRVCKLSYNEIATITKNHFAQGMNLEWLSVDHNELEVIEPHTMTFEFMPHIQVLNLSHNKLSFLPQCFGSGLETLRYLDLSYNRLQLLPDSVTDCVELQLCYLQSNEIVKLPAGIHRFTKLRKLWVSYNHITELPDGIGQCTSLEKLQASSNKLQVIPDSFINLWQKTGGKLEELRLDGNPLVSPGLSAFEKGQLNIGFELFMEWMEERDAELQKKALEAEKAKMSQQQALEFRTPDHQQVLDAVMHAQDTIDTAESIVREQPASAIRLSTTSGTRRSLADMRALEMDAASGGEEDVGRVELDIEEQDLLEAEEERLERRREIGQDWYFSHLADAATNEIGDLRSAESSLLLVKKVRYIEGTKALAKSKIEEMQNKGGFPRHLQKFLDPGLTSATFTGKIPVTEVDLQFCTLVYITKPMASSCKELFEKFQFLQGRAELTKIDWDRLCMHVQTYIPKEIQLEIWEMISRGKDHIKLTDFIAGWHIHDLEDHDPWIRRAAKVLKLTYYTMDLQDLRERIQAKHGADAEIAFGVEDAIESSSDSHSSASSGESDLEEQKRRARLVELPQAEGEWRWSNNKGARGKERDGHGKARAPAVKPPIPPGGGGGSSGSTSRKTHRDQSGRDTGIAMGMVSLTEEQQFALSRQYEDDSAQSSASSDESFESEELSLSSLSSVKSFDALSVLNRMEEEEQAKRKAEQHAERRRIEVKSDEDIKRLMEMPIKEILARPDDEEGEGKRESQREAPRLTAARLRELHSKNTPKDMRYRTDVYTVRLAIREARRNMTAHTFSSLVAYLLRCLKKMEHAHPALTFLHVDDPNFRHNTGVEDINPYVRQLLEQMGFACLQERYWIWPDKHLRLGDTTCWGLRQIKQACPGREPARIVDMVNLFAHYQKKKWTKR